MKTKCFKGVRTGLDKSRLQEIRLVPERVLSIDLQMDPYIKFLPEAIQALRKQDAVNAIGDPSGVLRAHALRHSYPVLRARHPQHNLAKRCVSTFGFGVSP